MSDDSHAHDDASPRLVIQDRYELGEKLGAGGMGAVYRAHDRMLGRDVAIKTLRVLDDRQQALLLREARHLSSIASGAAGGFVQQYDVIIDEGQIFLVQELIDGVPLSSWQRGRPLHDVLSAYARIA